jgi:hypothetical protein
VDPGFRRNHHRRTDFSLHDSPTCNPKRNRHYLSGV